MKLVERKINVFLLQHQFRSSDLVCFVIILWRQKKKWCNENGETETLWLVNTFTQHITEKFSSDYMGKGSLTVGWVLAGARQPS